MTRVRRAALRLSLAALAASACVAAHAGDAAPGCEPLGPAKPLCGFHAPEDLVLLPGAHALLVSEYGGMEEAKPGVLSLLDLASERRSVLFRGADAKGAPTPGWGDPACPGAPGPAFSPHGLGLARRSDGRLALAVVQHGGRESIELFELTGADRKWKVAWRGCVVAPPDAWFNDVALAPDGSFVVSHMASRKGGTQAIVRGEAGPGYALLWRAGEGFRELGGTRGALANGVELSPDGKKLFLNLYNQNEVRRVDVASGTLEARAAVLGPDNSTWSPDGKLLVASMRPVGAPDFKRCTQEPESPCLIPFAIVELDPVTMETRDLYRGDGVTMGLGTVGLRVGNELFVGSSAGNRVLRVRLAD